MFDAAFFDQKISRRGTDSEKWDGLFAQAGEDVLPMWVADMDFASPPAVTEALARRAAHPVYGYTMDAAEDQDAFLGFWRRRHGLTLDPEWLLMLPCVITGLRLMAQVCAAPGEGVIIQTPVYRPFFSAAQVGGRRLMENPLVPEDGRYQMDLAGLENQMRAGAKLLMLCNPHNPVGRAFTREELEGVLRLAKKYQVTVVVDEIHADFVYGPGRHIPILSLPGTETGVVALCSASKTFNIAGLKQAMLVTPDAALRERIARMMEDYGVVAGNLMALCATRAAYREGDAWLDGLIPYLAASRQIAQNFFAAELPRVILTPLEATYLMWLDCRALPIPPDQLQSRCREVGRVELTDGRIFGEAGAGFLRLNIGCPHAQLREALGRIKTALKGA